MIRADNDTYFITDWLMPGFTFSETRLKPHKETKGHQHDNPELYYFVSGSGFIYIDGYETDIEPHRIIPIKSNEFHKVKNPTDNELIFVCVWGSKSKERK